MSDKRDDHHLLARYRRDRDHARIVTNLSLELNRPATEARTYAHDAVDGWALRGIPAIGYGIPGGAINGTRPDSLSFLPTSDS